MKIARGRPSGDLWWGAAAAAATTLLLGLYHLGSRSLWGDEAFSVTLARQPLGEFWRVVSQSQANMSLYYVVLRAWTLAGDGEATVRLLSLVAAVAAVVVLYRVGAQLFNPLIGTIGALLLAVNGFFLRYAQEARSYALVTLLTAVATLLFVAVEERPDRRGSALGYVVVGALALYAHFFAVFVLAGHVLALAVAGRRLVPQVIRLAGIALLTAPLWFFAVFRDAGQISHLTRPTPRYVYDTLLQLAGGTRLLLLLYAAATLVAVGIWLRAPGRRLDWPMLVAVTWAATPIGGALLISIAKPVFAPRFLIVGLPGIVLVVAVGLTRGAPMLGLAAVAVIAVLSVIHVIQTQGEPQEDFRAATAFVLQHAGPRDAAAFYRTSRRIPFEYYARRQGISSLPKSLVPTSPYGRFDMIGDYRHTNLTAAELASVRAVASHRRVWLVLSRFENERVREKRQNRARLIAALASRARMRTRRLFAGLDVRLYTPRRAAATVGGG